jgi:hypothetical protein
LFARAVSLPSTSLQYIQVAPSTIPLTLAPYLKYPISKPLLLFSLRTQDILQTSRLRLRDHAPPISFFLTYHIAPVDT